MKFAHSLFIICIILGSGWIQAQPDKPNVVMILADDLGWQDVGCYDIDKPCLFETPNIDQLAKEGILFRQGYSPAPTCAPTRVAILTGKHPARTQKTHVVGGKPPSPYSKTSPLISPWYSGRMKVSEVTLPEVLSANGYKTGAVGKWHCAINHHAFPLPTDSGFEFCEMNLGETRKMKNRLEGFATTAEDDPYKLDENGFAKHQNSIDAINFVKVHKGDPFFLYYATWLVHTPIHTRNEALLKKYCEKMKIPVPTNPKGWTKQGQNNPYYAAMVETLDYHIGQLMTYLKETEDPRWPGHKLIENTYVIFTSDNGGMEKVPGEIITDNYPLDKGKINVKEGGIRVPLVMTGPGIKAGQESNTMINGLDFYPTILSWTGSEQPESLKFDGEDISTYVADDLTDPPKRDTMMWHFPHSGMQSTIRQGGFKLVRNWRQTLTGAGNGLELYQLYDEQDPAKRVDIEEKKNLASKMSKKAKHLDLLLTEQLESMQASPPFLNPAAKGLPKSAKICEVSKQGIDGNKAWIEFAEQGAKVTRAQIIYTDNGGHKYEEWYRLPAKLTETGRAEATIPEKATHYVWNLIDENHFLVSYPKMRAEKDSKDNYSEKAIAVAK